MFFFVSPRTFIKHGVVALVLFKADVHYYRGLTDDPDKNSVTR